MDNTHDPPDDTRARSDFRSPRDRGRDEPDDPEPTGAAPEVFDPFTALLGAVLMVPNSHWGFEGVTSTDHPGVCPRVRSTGRHATLLKGTDADHVRHRADHFVVDPTDDNRLAKSTGFELVPRLFKMHRLKLYVPGRRLGYLDGATLRAIRTELARLHPEE